MGWGGGDEVVALRRQPRSPRASGRSGVVQWPSELDDDGSIPRMARRPPAYSHVYKLSEGPAGPGSGPVRGAAFLASNACRRSDLRGSPYSMIKPGPPRPPARARALRALRPPHLADVAALSAGGPRPPRGYKLGSTWHPAAPRACDTATPALTLAACSPPRLWQRNLARYKVTPSMPTYCPCYSSLSFSRPR